MVVYKITNKINNKCYIGSTKHFKQRMREHINSAHYAWHQSYNFPLQRAFRKYGVDNFSFDIIEDNISVEDIAQKERQYIIEFKSMQDQHGYNQTLETDCALRDPAIIQSCIAKTGKKCALVDVNMNIIEKYNSLHEAARSLGLQEASCIRVVCLGEHYSIRDKIFRFLDDNDQVIDYGFKTRKCKKGVIGFSIYNKDDIVIYESVSEAARQEHTDRGSLGKCLRGDTKYSNVKQRVWREYRDGLVIDNGLNIDDIIFSKSGYCTIDYTTGERTDYPSLNALLRQCGYNNKKLKNLIDNNIILDNIGYYKLDIYSNPIIKEGDY